MRICKTIVLLVALVGAACTNGSGTPMGPSSGQTMSGTWVGAASDSTGSMMGAGLTSAMMASTTWTVTQTGNAFNGTMQFPGHMGAGMTVSGTINGHGGRFTMTMGAGSMMSGACTATANGTFDMDDMMSNWSGTYTGANSCTGPFDHGVMSMHR